LRLQERLAKLNEVPIDRLREIRDRCEI